MLELLGSDSPAIEYVRLLPARPCITQSNSSSIYKIFMHELWAVSHMINDNHRG
jgi:hypothetical protein